MARSVSDTGMLNGMTRRAMSSMPVEVLIVDQDVEACAQIKEFCARTDDVRIVGEARCGADGLHAAEILQPALLLLAIELPDTSGFDLLRALRLRHPRHCIMMTNDLRDGSTAIAAGAIGCLVKPLTEHAFGASVRKARQRLVSGLAAFGATTPVIAHKEADAGQPVILVGERDHRLYPLDPVQIDFVESAGNYVKYHLAQIDYIARDSIKRLDTVLASAGFVRIERSILLNIRSIAYVQPTSRGAFAFTLSSGERLHSGRAYRDAILSALPLRGHVARRNATSPVLRAPP